MVVPLFQEFYRADITRVYGYYMCIHVYEGVKIRLSAIIGINSDENTVPPLNSGGLPYEDCSLSGPGHVLMTYCMDKTIVAAFARIVHT